MTYTLNVNGKKYKLNEDFRAAIERRAELAYEDNRSLSCWWQVADKDNYTEDAWENNVHEVGDPILTIETVGTIVPWDRLDQLTAEMQEEMTDDDDELEDVDAGNGMKTIPPENAETGNQDIFGRTHFSMTPKRFEESPSPQGRDPEKIPPKPESFNEPEMVLWLPEHPEMEHTWSTGEAIAEVTSWVEWNIQQRANQPRPSKGKPDSHDGFESLCRLHGCEKVGEYKPTDSVPSEKAGSVERKGERAFEEGRFGGNNWGM